MSKTNFDLYLEEQLQDAAFAARFAQAGEAWDVALQIAALRQQAGLSQKDLARLLNTSQQQVSRLESPRYEGHSLNTLRRVAAALHARVRVVFEPAPEDAGAGAQVAETPAPYRTGAAPKASEVGRGRRYPTQGAKGATAAALKAPHHRSPGQRPGSGNRKPIQP